MSSSYDPPPPTAAHLAELAVRWRDARAAAIHSPGDERAQQRCAFDNSLRLGQGFARFHRAEVNPRHLPEVLAQLDAPCLQGSWSEVDDEAGYWLARPPCRERAAAGFCDHWRDAIDGLVLGLTGGVRHTRHQSAGHGGTRCLDVFYADPESSLRYGVLPPELAEGLASVRKLVQQFKGGAEVKFLGVSEGELLYELYVPRGEGACGGGSQTLQQIVERCLRKHFPALTPRELSPRPVLDTATQPEGAPR
jgi:hypothetical protein